MSIERTIDTASDTRIVVALRVPGHVDIDIHQHGESSFTDRLTTADAGRLIEHIRARLS